MEHKKIQGVGTGYVWMSDATSPQVYIQEPIALDLSNPGIPFVAEAYVVVDRTSYSVRMVDGSYRISTFSLEGTDASDYTEAVYYPNRLSQVRPEVAQLKFRKYWKEEPDPLCEGMPVLVPAEEVFVGFVLQGKEK